MLIDWFTVGAQAINFLILVWLLKRFLYRPVLAAIDAREKKVAARLLDAAAREAQAQTERDDLRRRNEAFDHDREDLLRKATAEAAAERQRLIEAARRDTQTLRTRLTESLAKERAELNRRLLEDTQAEVLALARGALTDLAGVSLEDRMIEVFTSHLRELRLAAKASPAEGIAVVRSAFEIPAAKRSGIETAIHHYLGADANVRFETSPGLVCGIELRVGGAKLAWSIADYLASITAKVAEFAGSESASPVSGLAPTSVPASGPAAPSATETQHGS